MQMHTKTTSFKNSSVILIKHLSSIDLKVLYLFCIIFFVTSQNKDVVLSIMSDMTVVGIPSHVFDVVSDFIKYKGNSISLEMDL